MRIVPRYTILETSIGPVISESRVTVYDVLLALQEGLLPMEISITYNLTPLQVETALDYINTHRPILETELVEIRHQRAEREAYYNALATELERAHSDRPSTPLQQEVKALLTKVRERRQAEAQSQTHLKPQSGPA